MLFSVPKTFSVSLTRASHAATCIIVSRCRYKITCFWASVGPEEHHERTASVTNPRRKSHPVRRDPKVILVVRDNQVLLAVNPSKILFEHPVAPRKEVRFDGSDAFNNIPSIPHEDSISTKNPLKSTNRVVVPADWKIQDPQISIIRMQA